MSKEIVLKTGDVVMPIEIRGFEDVHGITLCAIILNEEKDIRSYLNYYKPYVDRTVLLDGGSHDRTVELATTLADEIKIVKFEGHYGNQANRCLEMVKTDWVLFMDVDERLELSTLKNLRTMIDQDEFDCYAFPRKNYIDGVLDEVHFPDYQDKLYRAYCRKIRPVHEEIVGWKKRKEMPAVDGNFIVHSKGSARHHERNKVYQIYCLKFINEMGRPGAQMKDSFDKEYPEFKISIDKNR